MTYLALYREWRPRNFTEVVGQDHVVRTLVNALKKNRHSHAYLFCGPRGTGKTSVAKILARAVNCASPQGVDPCGACASCLEIESGTSMDVSEIDAASNRGIDEVRELREKVKFAPSSGKVRVFIIDEVHMLTNEAFNALLKTLEEPPAHAMFILATTEPHKVPLTILSRCQRFDYHRIGRAEMLGRLRAVAAGSGIDIEGEALEMIVRAAEGGMRDALSILDQASAYGEGRIGVEEIHGILGTVREELLQEAAADLLAGRAGELLGLVAGVADQGKDLRIFLKEFNSHLRGMMLDLLRAGSPGGGEIDRLSGVIHRLTAAEQELRWSSQPRVLLEVALVRAARAMAGGDAGEDRLGELISRLREVEALVARLSGSPGASRPAAGPAPAAVRPQAVPGGGAGAPQTAVPEGAAAISPPAVKATGGQGREQGGRRPEEEKRITPAYNKNSQKAAPPGPQDPGQGQTAGAAAGNRPSPDLLVKVESRWADILEVARKVCPHIAPHLTLGKGWPMELEGNTLTIGFPRSESYSSVAVDILGSEANCKELSGLIKSVCQADLRVRLALSDRKPPKKTRPQKKAVQPDEAVALFGKEEEVAVETFDDFDSLEGV